MIDILYLHHLVWTRELYWNTTFFFVSRVILVKTQRDVNKVEFHHGTTWWFQLFFALHPYLGKWSNLTIFPDGLVQPPTREVHLIQPVLPLWKSCEELPNVAPKQFEKILFSLGDYVFNLFNFREKNIMRTQRAQSEILECYKEHGNS